MKLSDMEIVELLQSRERRKEDNALSYLLPNHLHKVLFKMTIQFVNRNNGTREDGEDILQEALMAFFKLARNRQLQQIRDYAGV